MASSPITSWETDGETTEAVRDFILGGSKITADGDCSHEIKRWKKSYDSVEYNKLWKKRNGDTRPPDLSLEKLVCRSGSNS